MMETRSPDRTLLRFLLVGGSFAALYAILAAWATSHLPLHKALSSAVIWIVCVPITFWCHRHFTFSAQRPHLHGLLLYAVTQTVGVTIAATISGLLARGSFWPDLLVHVCASGLVAIVSFLIARSVIFLPQSAD
jgi:putative flippase GtrA